MEPQNNILYYLIIGVIIIIFLVILIKSMIRDWKEYNWKTKVRPTYHKKLMERNLMPEHTKRIRDWLCSKEAEKLYVESKDFDHLFNWQSDHIGDKLIEELKKRYADEFKSGNKKSS